MLKPKLSIIIPVYNTSEYLKKCLDSILENKQDEIEIIIVDDGSTDGSSTICEQYLAIPQIRIIHQKNMGVSRARNVGIDLCKGEYITFVDSDDYVSDDYVDVILTALKTERDMYFFGGKNIANKKVDRQNRGWIYMYDELVSNNKLIYDMVLSGKTNEPWDKVFKKDIITQFNIRFDERTSLGEDIIFTLEYLKHITTIQLIKKDIYFYRILMSGLSRKTPKIDILESRNSLFINIFNFIDCMKLEKGIIDDAYVFMLQIIVNCCGKLSKSHYSDSEIGNIIKTFSWNDKLGNYRYKDIKSKIRRILWKYKKYKLMGLIFNSN